MNGGRYDCSRISGNYDAIDRELERYKEFERVGLTDLALRVFDEPMGAVKVIAERVVPQLSLVITDESNGRRVRIGTLD